MYMMLDKLEVLTSATIAGCPRIYFSTEAGYISMIYTWKPKTNIIYRDAPYP